MVFRRFQRDRLSLCKDFMPPVFAMPFRQRRGSMHAFDHLTPADSRVVGAEGNLAFLRSIGDDAHFRAPEVVRPQILEPHSLYAKNTPFIAFGSRLHAV